MKTRIATAMLLLVPALTLAQVPVDDDGNVIGKYEPQSNITPIVDDGIPRLSFAELQDLVGPIALYPDDLLAIVLPASAYPLQVVEASRFLKALEIDPTLQPDADWDDSIVALINYPEVVALLNEDLDWTLRLGEAVVAQQTDVVAAIEGFRDRAYAAGNLKTDEYQTVSNDDGVISISPVAEDVIYVPYYEPARVVYAQPRPVYYYYPRAYPVYYYPYAANHHFNHGFFWGVTTAFSIGWMSDSLHVHHHSYYGHPYYGRTYWNDGWYRRPSISVYNTTYINNHRNVNRYGVGDQWRASNKRREYVRREGYSRNDRRIDNRSNDHSNNRSNTRSISRSSDRSISRSSGNDNARDAISFREREARGSRSSGVSPKQARKKNPSERSQIQFARRDDRNARTQTARRQEPASRTQVQTTRRQEPTTRTQVQTTRRQQPANRTQVQTTRREQSANRTQVQTTRRQEPAVRSQSTTRSQTTRSTPRPTQQRAPARQQPRQSAPPPRAEPKRSSPPRESRSSGGDASRSENRSTERRSRRR